MVFCSFMLVDLVSAWATKLFNILCFQADLSQRCSRYQSPGGIETAEVLSWVILNTKLSVRDGDACDQGLDIVAWDSGFSRLTVLGCTLYRQMCMCVHNYVHTCMWVQIHVCAVCKHVWAGSARLKVVTVTIYDDRWNQYLVLTELTQFFCPQFLPVYCPSEEEKRNPALYASNVRRVMAK